MTSFCQLASEMTDWLRRMGVGCWNATELGMDYSDMDESGVPYGIVLSVQTLQDGILCVRHRDSSLKVGGARWRRPGEIDMTRRM